MFAEIDRVDIVFETEDGKRIGVQTDDRRAAEQAEEPELSLVFGILRVLTARGLDAIVYASPEEPPSFLREALECAGAQIRVADEELDPVRAEDLDATDRQMRAALHRIGLAVLAAGGFEATQEGLLGLEAQVLRARGDGFEDTEVRARAWVELAAAAGVIFSALHGGQWARRDLFGDTVPYAWVLGGYVANVFGRAYRLVLEGIEPGPSAQLDSLAEPAADGPILPLIRPAAFGGGAGPRSRPLLAVADEAGPVDVPHVFLVRDRPSSVEYLDIGSDEDFEGLFDASLHNLARVAVPPQRVGGLPIYLLDGDFYAGSKILDRSLIQGLAEALDAEVLFASFPARGAVLIGAGEFADFFDLTTQLIADTPESERICDEVFLATPGEGLCGVISSALSD